METKSNLSSGAASAPSQKWFATVPFRAGSTGSVWMSTVRDNYGRQVGSGISRDSAEEALERATLIAAAPDLLEALQAILSYDEINDALPTYYVKKARAAIAKASLPLNTDQT